MTFLSGLTIVSDIDFHIGLPRPLQWRAARFTEQSFYMTIYQALHDMTSFKLLVNFLVHKDPILLRAFTNPEVISYDKLIC